VSAALHSSTLRAPDAGKPVSLVRECEADRSAIRDVASKEETSQCCRAKRTRVAGKKSTKSWAVRRRAYLSARRASVFADKDAKRFSKRDCEFFEQRTCKRLRPWAASPRLARRHVQSGKSTGPRLFLSHHAAALHFSSGSPRRTSNLEPRTSNVERHFFGTSRMIFPPSRSVNT
jgi:hypothetical protein